MDACASMANIIILHDLSNGFYPSNQEIKTMYDKQPKIIRITVKSR